MAAHTKIDLYQMQSLPLDAKIRMTARRIDAFIDRNDAYLSITCGKQTLWEQRKAQRLKRGLQQCRKRQQQWKVYKTGKERGVAWAAP